MATGNTPNYSFPYPLSTDPVNVASDIQELSDTLDAFLTSPAFINNLAINAGSLVTSSATAALFNTGATTLNIGGAATTINVGATTGQVNVRGNFNIATGKVYEINDVTVLSATTLGSSVVSSSLTSVGTLTTGTWNAGNILLPLGASSSPSLAFTGDTNTGMWSPTADTVAFSTGGSDRMRITSAGNVGIGTSSPVAKLHISADGLEVNSELVTSDFMVISVENQAPGLSIISASETPGNRGVFKAVRSRGTLLNPTVPTTNDNVLSLLGAIYDGNGNNATAEILMLVDGTVSDGITPQRIEFKTGETTSRTTRMTIKSNGNVGIGQTAPTSPLEINTTTQTSLGDVADRQRGAVFLGMPSGGTTGDGNLGPAVAFSGINTSRRRAAISAVQTSSDEDQVGLLFAVHSSAIASNDTLGEAMRITHAGNVGIGTTAPTAELQVATAGTYSRIKVSNATTGAGTQDGFDLVVSNSDAYIVQRENAPLVLFTAGTERMRIDSAGVINITGSQIVMESGTTGAPTDNVSFKVERGTSPDVEIRWNETGDGWQFTNDGTNYYDIPTSAAGGTGLQDILMFAGM